MILALKIAIAVFMASKIQLSSASRVKVSARARPKENALNTSVSLSLADSEVNASRFPCSVQGTCEDCIGVHGGHGDCNWCSAGTSFGQRPYCFYIWDDAGTDKQMACSTDGRDLKADPNQCGKTGGASPPQSKCTSGVTCDACNAISGCGWCDKVTHFGKPFCVEESSASQSCEGSMVSDCPQQDGIPPEFKQLDPALQNPKVIAALQDLRSHPENMVKYQSDPEVMSAVMKLAAHGGN
eukprot:gnl/MRDRNA2_/MRDRNA2_112563_c0_seq1.p1 gnl/MRDRNA2_/MRDRNA2_112563_c0~~gnl/MRDRNA2_/MRDRNA2_112563_c0_seq1.p1  ORF type:complete len:240 (+),score=35.59 gnl/MRDRNA2_/MRDRNA2_112563_c0_seq1:91-810(+)